MATTSLGRLTLDLVAQIGQFVEPLNKAERKARDSAKSIAKEFDVATIAVKALGAAAAGISVASVMNFASEFINSATEIDRSAKLVGASTQQFQYFAAGAKVAGISLEKFADINKDVNDRLGEARRGEGEMMDFFTKIAPRVGITIDQFKKLSGPEALQLYYNGLQKANLSHAEQITYMEQIANDAGLLIPMLKDGGAGFKEWGDQAQKAGTIMSDELMVQLITAKENLQILDLKWQGLKATMVNEVMPAFTFVSNNIDNIKAGSMALGAYLVVGMVPAFVKGTVGAISYGYQLIRLTAFTGGLAASTTTLKTALSALGGFGGLGFLALQGLAAGAAFLFMKNKSEDVTGSLNIQGESVDDLISKYEKLNLLEQRNEKRSISQTLEKERVAYVSASSNLSAYIEYMKESGLVSEDTGNKLQLLYNEYAKGNIDAVKFSTTITNMTGVQQKQKDEVDKLTSAHVAAKSTYEKTKQVQEQLKTAHEATTKAVKAQKDAYADLSEKQKQALMDIDKELNKRKYVESFIKAGGSREKAEYFYNYRESAGLLGTGKPLSPIEISKINQGFSLNNYSLDANDRKKIAGAMAYAVKNNIEDLAKAGGIPQNLLTGLLATESGGKNLTSPTGATGHWQTTSAFREQHAKILKAGNYSETAFTQAVIKDLQDNYKKFGNWPDAIMAYNGGAGGVDAFKAGRVSDKVKTQGGYQKIGGVGYLSPAKYQEMKTHQERTLKYASGAGGSSKIDPSIAMPSTDDLLKLQNDAVQVKKSLDDAKATFEKQLATPLKQMDIENSETIKKLQETYADDPKKLKEMLDKNDVLYQANRNKLIAEKQNEYNQYFSFEKDRITQVIDNYDYEISKIKENTDYTISERNKMAAAKEREKQAEIASIKLEQKEQILSANEAYMSETEAMLQRYEIEREQIKLTKSLPEDAKNQLLEANSMAVYQVMERNRAAIADAQQEALASRFMRNNSGNYGQFDGSYQQWDMQNAYGVASGGIDQAYNDQVSGINLIEDDEQRKQQLLEAEQRYLEAKKALNDEYNEQERDARNAMQADNIATYGAMFGGMADLVKGYAGESSGAYRTMIAAQKAANLASAIMSGYTSIAAAWGSKPFPYNLPAVAIATAKAGVFQAAIQAVTPGFYDGGYTGHGGKYDPAGIVHKGEGVLTQEEIAALGGPAGFEYLRKAIRTGDLFNNSEILASKFFMEMAGYSDGGIVGGGDVRLSGYSMSPKISTISSKPSATTAGGDITIQVNVTDSGVSTSGGNTQDQRQLAQVIGNTVRAVIRQEKRQGGLLSK